MIVAIMQPYFFPYLGYFQLMAQCDTFIVLDDVQFVKHRWINRNRIRLNESAMWLTYPVAAGPSKATIRDRAYVADVIARKSVLNRLHHAYRKAPYYETTIELVDACLDVEDPSIAVVNAHLLRSVATHLELKCEFRTASDFGIDPAARAEARIIALCERLGADEYLNPIGGVTLYRSETFAKHGMRLSFLKSESLVYPQGKSDFVPSLSVIDALMYCDAATLRALLSRCQRIDASDAQGTA